MTLGSIGVYALALVTAPPPEEVKETARRILSGDAYDLRTGEPPPSWIGEAIRWLFQKIVDLINSLFPSSVSGSPYFMYTVVAVLTVVVVGLMVHIVYSIYRAMRPRGDVALDDSIEESHDVDELIEEAGRRAEEGDYVGASRMLFRAALVRLEAERGGRVQQGLTNNEYIRTFRTPWVIENLRVFADLINWKWYRDRDFDAEDYQHCRAAYDRLDLRLREET